MLLSVVAVFIFYLRPKKTKNTGAISQVQVHVQLDKSMSICLKCSARELTKPMPNALQIKIAQPLCHNEMAFWLKPAQNERAQCQPEILMKFVAFCQELHSM